MDAEVHARKAHQHKNHDADPPQAVPLRRAGDAAECTDGILRVAAGEGEPRGFGAGALDDGEVRIEHPRPRDAAQELEKLVEHRPQKSDGQQIISLVFVDAPEDEDGDCEKGCLAAEVRDAAHQPVARGGAEALEQIE